MRHPRPQGNLSRSMTKEQRRALTEFLLRPDMEERGAYTFAGIQGLFFAIIPAPRSVLPSEWLPLVFGGELPVFSTHHEATEIITILMLLYNEVADDVMRGDGRLPKDIVFLQNTIDNLDPDAPVSQWSRGFADGYFWLEDDLNEYEDKLDGLGLVLWILCFFTIPEVAKTFSTEVGMSLEEGAANARKNFRGAAAEYAELALACREAARRSSGRGERGFNLDVSSIPFTVRDTGRNQRCPCGSGKKYKRCCGRGD